MKSNYLVTGGTGSGKSCGVLSEVLYRKTYHRVFYASSRRSELAQKAKLLLETQQNHRAKVVYHADYLYRFALKDEKRNSEDVPEVHLFTADKLLLWFLHQCSLEDGSASMPDWVILDEIDNISTNSRYELLLAVLRHYQELGKLDASLIGLSAVLNTDGAEALKKVLGIEGEVMEQSEVRLQDSPYIHKLPFQKRTVRHHVIPWIRPRNDHIVEIIERLYSLHRSQDQTLIIFQSKKALRGMVYNPRFCTKTMLNLRQDPNSFRTPLIRDGLKNGLGIIYRGLYQSETEELLSLFDAKTIKLLICTNTLESGIDIDCDVMMVVETANVPFNTAQWINFEGRVGRRKGVGTFYAIVSRQKHASGWRIENEIGKAVQPKSSLPMDDLAPFMQQLPGIERYTLYFHEGKPLPPAQHGVYQRLARECFASSLPYSRVKRNMSDICKYADSPSFISLEDVCRGFSIKAKTCMQGNSLKQLCYLLKLLYNTYDHEASRNCLNTFLGRKILRLSDTDYKKFLKEPDRFNYYALRGARLL